jgi:hypothetical protein
MEHKVNYVPYFDQNLIHSFLCYRLYYTTVQLGSPPREFHVQIDTGSDVLWVSCSSCTGCPQSTGLKVSLFLIHILSL